MDGTIFSYQTNLDDNFFWNFVHTFIPFSDLDSMDIGNIES